MAFRLASIVLMVFVILAPACVSKNRTVQPPRVAGVQVPARMVAIDFTQRYNLLVRKREEPEWIRNCRILGFTGSEEQDSGGYSKIYRFLEHWLVLEYSDGRLAYIEPDTIVQIEEVRKADHRLAMQEEQRQRIQKQREYETRLTSEKIDGVYIPKDLCECLVELDKSVKEIDKKEIQALPNRDDMIKQHHGLGTTIRNSWGLWEGSRLQKYFTDRGIAHPNDMSWVVLSHYHDWLSGNKQACEDWEKKSSENSRTDGLE